MLKKLILAVTLFLGTAFTVNQMLPMEAFAYPSPTPTTLAYVSHAPITATSNTTIKGYVITGGSSACITLTNVSNVHITKCKLIGSTKEAIRMTNCTNIYVDSCRIDNVELGILALNCTNNIQITNNEITNVSDPLINTHGGGAHIQFNNTNGTGLRIMFNRCESYFTAGGTNPNFGTGDVISLYKSNGTAADYIKVYNNWIRGGGTLQGSQGRAGMLAGDLGGQYQDFQNNILVNTGYAGFQIQGGSHIIAKNNTIYGVKLPWSGAGLNVANYSGVASTDVTVTGNTIYWDGGVSNINGPRDTSWKPGSGTSAMPRPTGWSSNTVRAHISATILPNVIITNFIDPVPPKVYRRVKH